MNKEELLKKLNEKEELLKRAEIMYHQLTGQTLLLKDLLKDLENKKE
jgi:hypothetical protein